MKSKSRRSLLMKRRLSFRVKRRSHCDSDQFEFDNVNPALTAMKSAKKCAAASEFLFFFIKPVLFLYFLISVVEVLVVVAWARWQDYPGPAKHFLICDNFLL